MGLFKQESMKRNLILYKRDILRKGLIIKRDKEDKRDYLSKAKFKAVLPSNLDLTMFCMPIRNQGVLRACTGFMGVSAYEVEYNIQHNVLAVHSDIDGSELFVYYNSRLIEGTIGQDSGATVRDTCKSLVKYGACYESFWPYVEKNYTKVPSWVAYFVGRFTRKRAYYRCVTVDDIKTALANKKPVLFAMEVYTNYFSYHTGSYKKISGKAEGGHAQLIVGYDDSKHAFKIRNSWGPNWGIDGYAWIDYDYLMGFLFDAWTIE